MILCAIASVSAAAQPAALGPGLDVVFVIDRSKSIADRDAATLLLHLALDIIARNGRSLRLHHRFGVIGFGSTVSVDMPLTGVDASSLGLWHRRIDRLQSTARGDTDVLAAFHAAAAMFDPLPRATFRRRAIVMVTDGVAYVRGVNMHDYKRDLRLFAGAHFRSGDPTVDVLLLASPSGKRQTALWRALSFDRVHAAGDRASLLMQTHRIATRLVGTASSESVPSYTDDKTETLIVPPYLDVVVLDVFRSGHAATVEVFPPGAMRPLIPGSDGAEGIGLGSVISTLVLRRPPPGTWMVRKSRADARVRILSQQFFPRGLLLRPAVGEAVQQHDHVRVAYSVVDADGRTLEELPGYKLSLDLSVTKPDGSVESIAMERRPELAGTVFAAVRESDCVLPGRYWTTVGVTSIDSAEAPVDVFRDRWSGFSVAPAERADCSDRASVATGMGCVDGYRQRTGILTFRGGPFSFVVQLLQPRRQGAAILGFRFGQDAFRGWPHGAERAPPSLQTTNAARRRRLSQQTSFGAAASRPSDSESPVPVS